MSKSLFDRASVIAFVVAVVTCSCVVNPGYAQEAEPAAKVETKSKFRGRLPAYYKNVVSELQRKQIYDIQRKYYEQILALQDQIQQITELRNQEVQEVLTDKQLARVEELKGDAATRRDAAKEADANAPADSEPADPDRADPEPAAGSE